MNSNISRDIVLLLEFGLKNTYFSFQGQFYEEVQTAAMDLPVSPIVANLYMEYSDQKVVSTTTMPSQVIAPVCGCDAGFFGGFEPISSYYINPCTAPHI